MCNVLSYRESIHFVLHIRIGLGPIKGPANLSMNHVQLEVLSNAL